MSLYSRNNGSSYINSFTTFITTGNLYLVPRSTLNLSAGNYIIMVNGAGANGMALRITFGSGNQDTINIRATLPNNIFVILNKLK
ncbi:hypothetical protein [Chryseobacterium herbae]|uniref:DUF4397 domain-containing protein n=1 Tax=Chryseobacterium herbae TaxID=2976476 RepID=A0ABT2ISK6_9FLAO|nr:hypothetical protein [Chryseobacterium sp. pc1-10]MCT2561491.1 hypothetical protein [Chryseobacterium sp. pc1-10]